jgi:hypothetical protein
LLSAIVAVKAFAMGSAICAMLLPTWAYEGKLEVIPLAIFAAAAGASAWLGGRIYRSMLPAPSGSSQVAVASSQVP